MKIKVVEDISLNEIEVVINCPKKDTQVEKIYNAVKSCAISIMGKSEGENYVIDINDIYYFEAVDNKVFAYCEKEIYEVSYKLHDLVEMLAQSSFMQTARTIVLNIKKIKKVNTLVNGRILAMLSNGEKIIITRLYAQKFKAKLKE